MNTPKKWIRQEIESLDPHKDYVRIWQLCSGYGTNDFINNLMYTLTFPNFIVSDYGSEVVWRDDGGKVLHRAGSRMEQTQNANALWWWYGPHDERTRKAVDSINRLHAYWAGKYPGVFSHNVDYVYVFAYTAVAMHRLRLQMGAPGISEKEQVAAHKFWGEMSKLFVAENNVPIHGYPDDFAGLLKLCEDYENTPRPKPERTNLVTTAIHEQFVFRFFPEELHWLGHQLVRSLTLPTTLEAASIDLPYPPAKEVLPKFMGLIFWYLENMLDDPPRSYIEEREAMSDQARENLKATIKELDKKFAPHFVSKYKDDPKFMGCPFHAAMGAQTKTSPTPGDIEKIEATAIGDAK
jgi:hypothetical protein